MGMCLTSSAFFSFIPHTSRSTACSRRSSSTATKSMRRSLTSWLSQQLRKWLRCIWWCAISIGLRQQAETCAGSTRANIPKNTKLSSSWIEFWPRRCGRFLNSSWWTSFKTQATTGANRRSQSSSRYWPSLINAPPLLWLSASTVRSLLANYRFWT